jgi:hypothetical protein
MADHTKGGDMEMLKPWEVDRDSDKPKGKEVNINYGHLSS